jgi:excisionase family DNA binding protein
MDEVVTITQAADILGVHKNTVRTWVKRGKIASTKVASRHGDTYVIPRSALEHPPSDTPDLQLPSDTPSLVVARDNTPMDAAVSRIIEPFVSQLREASQEVGELRARVKQLEAQLSQGTVTAPPTRLSWWERVFGGGGE